MSRWPVMFFTLVSAYVHASGGGQPETPTGTPCSDAWNHAIEKAVATGDGRGHGPDMGSDEWKSVIEFKLGIRGQPQVPHRDTLAWCQYIDQRVSATDTGAKY